ncbi:MAG: tRNA lysidine(34) synthetase TilS [Filifactoraceae bacterium]
MLIEKVEDTIKREGLLEEGDSVLVALSGGPDSVCLIRLLADLRERYSLKIYSFHLNHQIRGVDAHKDALYALKLSESMGIPCFTLSLDVPELSKSKKTTVEEEARNQRYIAMNKIADKLNIKKIAVAHNLDDQSETVVMRLIRGTGLNGLKGMEYKRDRIIRPLMDADKKSILKYCEENKINPCVDKTNLEDEYTRNKIRLKLIPFIEQEFGAKFKENIFKMANVLREDGNFIEGIAYDEYKKTSARIDESTIKLELEEEIAPINIAILKRMIRNCIKDLVGNIEGIEGVHLLDIVNLIRNGKNTWRVNIPKGITVYKNNDSIIFTTSDIKEEVIYFDYEIELDGLTIIPEIKKVVEAKIMPKEKCVQLPTGLYTKAFDINKISGKLRIRNRIAGDKIRPVGLGGTKKIKDIFIDAKIPLDKREEMPLIVDDEKIIWVCGLKISEESKIGETTENVVRISIKDL